MLIVNYTYLLFFVRYVNKNIRLENFSQIQFEIFLAINLRKFESFHSKSEEFLLCGENSNFFQTPNLVYKEIYLQIDGREKNLKTFFVCKVFLYRISKDRLKKILWK